MSAAVILMAYGSPERLEDVPAYYADIRGGHPVRPELLEDLVERYRRLGVGGDDGSPMLSSRHSPRVRRLWSASCSPRTTRASRSATTGAGSRKRSTGAPSSSSWRDGTTIPASWSCSRSG